MQDRSTDRWLGILFVGSVAFLAFLTGAGVVLARLPPSESLRRLYLAGVALYWQVVARDETYSADLWKPAPRRERGVTVLDRNRVQPGYTLYTSGDSARASLIDLDGRVLHEWRLPYRAVWQPGTGAVRRPVAESHIYFRKAQLLPDGSLLVLYDGVGDTPHGYGLVRMDADSRPLWSYLQRAHHDFDIAPDGHVLVLTHEISEQVFAPRPQLRTPRIDDFVVELDASGRELRKIALLQALDGTPYLRLVDALPAYLDHNGDYLHTNNVDVVRPADAARFAFLRERQVLLSMREPSALLALDLDAQRVTWALRGSWVGQHDPDLLDNGHILLFDNNGGFEHEGRSRILEIDPATSAVAWQYGGPDQPLSSRVRGEQQRLPNGNTLITESDGGRLLEVAADGSLVWEFLNPVRAGDNDALVPVVSWGTRIDPASLDPAFRSRLEAASASPTRRPS